MKKRHPETRRRQLLRKWPLMLLLLVVCSAGWSRVLADLAPGPTDQTAVTVVWGHHLTAAQPLSHLPAVPVAQPKPVIATTSCATSILNQNIVVSISARHLWACDGTTSSYDSPVVTGMENLAADLTPTGVFHIYGKQTNLHLKGSDSTGSWDDLVSYWMPFLSNQYGVYGFHDATWRADSDFGSIDPYSSSGSHGCVELPLATAAWLYNWASIGTTVTIVS